MTDDRPSDLLSALPRSRPHRRSNKRPERPASTPAPEAPEAESAPAESTERKPTSSEARGRATKATKKRTGPTRATAKAPAKNARSTRGPAKGARGKTASPKPAAVRGRRLAQPAQPRGVPQATRSPRPEPSTEFPVLRTAVQAAAELAEIGVTLSAKALRRAVGRLPRP